MKEKNGRTMSFNPVTCAVLASVIYWIYLYFHVEPVVLYDSLGYKHLAEIICHQGWIEFFRTGPHREPAYPFLLSLSLWGSDLFSVSYVKILLIAQVTLLFAAQLLFVRLLGHLSVDRRINAIGVLYFGISPAIVNMAFSVYSEVVTYPLILGIVLCAARSLNGIIKADYKINILNGILLAVLFLSMTLVKAIYEHVFVIFALTFTVLAVVCWSKRLNKHRMSGFLFIAVFGIMFNLGTHLYKSLNQVNNGLYTIADSRGIYSLYSSAARRTEDMGTRRVLAGMAYTMGEGACAAVFTQEECRFWGINHYDGYGMTALTEVSGHTPKEDVPAVMMKMSFEQIKAKPVPFFFWTGMEWIRMMFWESTRIGFVKYPDALAAIFSNTIVKNTLRLAVSLATISAFFYSLGYLFQKRGRVFGLSGGNEGARDRLYFFAVFAVICHIGLYAIFMTIARFALPIAPLYLAIIAVACDQCVIKKST